MQPKLGIFYIQSICSLSGKTLCSCNRIINYTRIRKEENLRLTKLAEKITATIQETSRHLGRLTEAKLVEIGWLLQAYFLWATCFASSIRRDDYESISDRKTEMNLKEDLKQGLLGACGR